MTGFLDQQNGFWSQRNRPKITADRHCWLGYPGKIYCSDMKKQASHYHQDCQRRWLKEVGLNLSLKVWARVGNVGKREDVKGKEVFRCKCTNKFHLVTNDTADVESCYCREIGDKMDN